MVRFLCPKSSLIVARSTPSMTKWLAKVCLRSWNLKSFIPAFLRAEAKEPLISLKGTPFLPVNI